MQCGRAAGGDAGQEGRLVCLSRLQVVVVQVLPLALSVGGVGGGRRRLVVVLQLVLVQTCQGERERETRSNGRFKKREVSIGALVEAMIYGYNEENLTMVDIL